MIAWHPDYALRNRGVPGDRRLVSSGSRSWLVQGRYWIWDAATGADLAWFEQRGVAVIGADLSAGDAWSGARTGA